MSRDTAFFLILALLLSSTLSYATRPIPVPSYVATVSTTSTTKISENKGVVEESCEGVGQEECLMRRTLVAHLDYIYTQDKNP